MSVVTDSIQLKTSGYCDIRDITKDVDCALKKTSLTDGIVTVFIPGSTAGVTTIEYESGAIDDLKQAINRIAPENEFYSHDARWGDGNGFSHVRAALLGPSESFPFGNGKLTLGNWQQIIFVDFDNRSRQREIILKFIGE